MAQRLAYLPYLAVFLGLVLLCAVSLPAKPAAADSYCGSILRPWGAVAGDRDCDGFPDTQPTTDRGAEDYLTTHGYVACAATQTAGDEEAEGIHDAWPFDFNDDQAANLSDVLKLSPHFNQNAGDPGFSPRFDLNEDGHINNSDVLQFGTTGVFNHRCTEGIPTPPSPTTSRYLSTVDWGTLWNEGCAQARAYQSGLIILDFGQPAYYGGGSYGTLLFDRITYVTTSQIESAAEQFASGFFNCYPQSVPATYAVIAIGTNNYFGDTGYGQGAAWAMAVNDVSNFVHTVQWPGIDIVGGSDIETEYADADTTTAWVNGYSSNAQHWYYDYGDAGGCVYDGTAVDIPCNGVGWSSSKVWYVSYHNIWAWPFPSNYDRNGSQAAEWQALSIYAVSTGYSKIWFAGSLSEVGACETQPDSDCQNHYTDIPSSHSWSQLWTLLNADVTTAQARLGGFDHSDNWSSDITY